MANTNPNSTASAAQSKSESMAGTGFMIDLPTTLKSLEEDGYTENFVPKVDHLEARSGAIKLLPKDMRIDRTVRFENTSDPDDQSVLYAISSKDHKIKGVYVGTYGVYHDDLSDEMIESLSQGERGPVVSN